jgi:hypothetical protein
VASTKKFKAKGYPLRQYQKPGKVIFPRELPVAFAVCSEKCGTRQFIVDGGTQICENCGRSMFRLDVATYTLKKIRKSPNKAPQTTAMTPPPSTTRGAPLSGL